MLIKCFTEVMTLMQISIAQSITAPIVRLYKVNLDSQDDEVFDNTFNL